MYLLRKSTFFCSSTCHGAGRALSRAKSRRNIDYQQVLDKLQAQGISIRVASPKLVIFYPFNLATFNLIFKKEASTRVAIYSS